MSNFRITKNSNGEKMVHLDDDCISQGIEYVKNNSIKHLNLQDIEGLFDVSLLIPVSKTIESIYLNKYFDFSFFEIFKEVKTLHIPNCKEKVIDLTNFKSLEFLELEAEFNVKGTENCKLLNLLSIVNFKSSLENIEWIQSLHNLSTFYVSNYGFENLNGIEKLLNLRSLNLYNCRKLASIKNATLLLNLKQLEIEKCKNIEDYEEIRNAINLEKLIIADSSNLKSLSFLDNLKKLKYFVFLGVEVLDGDLKNCKGIEYVRFDDKKHYNQKLKDFIKSD